MTEQKKSGNIVAIVTMCFIFAMISFVTNMAAPFGNIWKGTYGFAGMLGNFMNFFAYLFMGIPAGKLIMKIGYKNTTLAALAVGFVGICIQWLSSKVGAGVGVFPVGEQMVELNYVIYLLGAFVCGFCVCMLNTVVNPMLTILGGGGNRGNQLVQTGGTLNSLTGTFTPLLVGALIGQITDKTNMSDVLPLLYIAMGVFAVAFIIIYCVKLVEPNADTDTTKMESSPWAFRHFVLGAVAIALYVGVEVGIPGELNFYLTGFEGAGVAVAGAIAAVYWLLMMVGRAFGTGISAKVSPRAQLVAVSSAAIVLILLAIFTPESISIKAPGYSINDGFAMYQVPISALFLILCGLCTSVMWGAIFALSVDGLGKYTALASGIFMMMVFGGGILPLVQDYIATKFSYMNSYWVIIAALLYILYYALSGSKNVNKDIKVD